MDDFGIKDYWGLSLEPLLQLVTVNITVPSYSTEDISLNKRTKKMLSFTSLSTLDIFKNVILHSAKIMWSSLHSLYLHMRLFVDKRVELPALNRDKNWMCIIFRLDSTSRAFRTRRSDSDLSRFCVAIQLFVLYVYQYIFKGMCPKKSIQNDSNELSFADQIRKSCFREICDLWKSDI